MFLKGDASPCRIPDIQTPFHELIIRESFSVGSGLHLQGMSESMYDKNRLGMNEIRYFSPNYFRISVLTDPDQPSVCDSQLGGFASMDPQKVFRHLFRKQGVVDSMALGVNRAPAESQPELPGRGG